VGALDEALADPALGLVEVREGGVRGSIERAEARFEIPLPSDALILIREVVNTATSRCSSIKTSKPSSSLPFPTRTG
jgi:hypothetical protein